jgi:hypothetical protein
MRSGLMSPRALALAAVVALLALPGLSHATTMYAFSPSELTYVADVVAEAVVEASSTEHMEGSLFLRTVTDLRLVQVYKGDVVEGDVLTLPLLGGALDGEETSLASAARFTPGERVLVYLESWEQGWRPIGMNQGVWTMVEEPTSGLDVLIKVHREYTETVWNEAKVQLPPPALRKYAAGTLQQIRSDVADAHVPTYDSIPGLPPAKDQRFKKDAMAQGQLVDPRYFAPGELLKLTREIEEERR